MENDEEKKKINEQNSKSEIPIPAVPTIEQKHDDVKEIPKEDEKKEKVEELSDNKIDKYFEEYLNH